MALYSSQATVNSILEIASIYNFILNTGIYTRKQKGRGIIII